MAHLAATGHAYRLQRYTRPILNPSGGAISLSTPTAGKIAGVVREGATPIPGATVGLFYRPNMRNVAVRRTDQNGVFLFSELDQTELNNYFVVALDPNGGNQYNAVVYDRLSAVTDLTQPIMSNGIDGGLFGTGVVEKLVATFTGYIEGLVPLSYWHLDEASPYLLHDVMGLADMTATNTFYYGVPSGTFDTSTTALRHMTVGSNECMTTGKVTGLVPGPSGYSVVGLMRLPAGAQSQSMFAWRNYTAGGADYIFAVCGRDHPDFGGDVGFQTWSFTTTATTVRMNGTKDDRWHLYGLSYDAVTNTMTLYVDGYPVDSRVQGTPPTWPTSASVTLFNNVDGVSAQSSNCDIDEFAVFNYPLTATQMMRMATLWSENVRWNYYDKSINITLSNNDTEVTTGGPWCITRTTHRKMTGRWYWENTVITAGEIYTGLSPYTQDVNEWLGRVAGSGGLWFYFTSSASYRLSGNIVASGLTPASVGTVVGHAYDIELGMHEVYINGVLATRQYGLSSTCLPAVAVMAGSKVNGTFKAPFAYTPPAGFAEYADAENTSLPATLNAWNPADKEVVWGVSTLRSEAVSLSTVSGVLRATVSKNSGRRYFEVKVIQGWNDTSVGVCDGSMTVSNPSPGYSATGWAYEGAGGKRNAVTYQNYGASFTNGDVIGVLVDFTAQTITFYKNGVSQDVAYSNISGTLFPAAGTVNSAAAHLSLNLGASDFLYAVPSGAVAWDS